VPVKAAPVMSDKRIELKIESPSIKNPIIKKKERKEIKVKSAFLKYFL
jgi:hypothetical protein